MSLPLWTVILIFRRKVLIQPESKKKVTVKQKKLTVDKLTLEICCSRKNLEKTDAVRYVFMIIVPSPIQRGTYHEGFLCVGDVSEVWIINSQNEQLSAQLDMLEMQHKMRVPVFCCQLNKWTQKNRKKEFSTFLIWSSIWILSSSLNCCLDRSFVSSTFDNVEAKSRATNAACAGSNLQCKTKRHTSGAVYKIACNKSCDITVLFSEDYSHTRQNGFVLPGWTVGKESYFSGGASG